MARRQHLERGGQERVSLARDRVNHLVRSHDVHLVQVLGHGGEVLRPAGSEPNVGVAHDELGERDRPFVHVEGEDPVGHRRHLRGEEPVAAAHLQDPATADDRGHALTGDPGDLAVELPPGPVVRQVVLVLVLRRILRVRRVVVMGMRVVHGYPGPHQVVAEHPRPPTRVPADTGVTRLA